MGPFKRISSDIIFFIHATVSMRILKIIIGWRTQSTRAFVVVEELILIKLLNFHSPVKLAQDERRIDLSNGEGWNRNNNRKVIINSETPLPRYNNTSHIARRKIKSLESMICVLQIQFLLFFFFFSKWWNQYFPFEKAEEKKRYKTYNVYLLFSSFRQRSKSWSSSKNFFRMKQWNNKNDICSYRFLQWKGTFFLLRLRQDYVIEIIYVGSVIPIEVTRA